MSDLSWLEAKLAHGPRPYPVAPLAERLGYAPDDPFLTGKLARDLDMNLGWVRRCRRLGLTTEQADRWACKAGVNPGEVWPAWYSDLRGVALAAANRLTCPQGHPLDRFDSHGNRRCAPCPRDAVRRYKSKNPQVVGLMTARRPDARHLQRMMVTVSDQEPNTSDWLTVREAAEILRVHTDVIYDAVARGDLPHVRIGRAIRISRAAFAPVRREAAS